MFTPALAAASERRVGADISLVRYFDKSANGVFDEGEGVEGARLCLVRDDGSLALSCLTDANGHAALEGVFVGNYSLLESQGSGLPMEEIAKVSVSAPAFGNAPIVRVNGLPAPAPLYIAGQSLGENGGEPAPGQSSLSQAGSAKCALPAAVAGVGSAGGASAPVEARFATEAGTPVGGIRLMPEARVEGNWQSIGPEGGVVTDSEGAARFYVLAGGLYRFSYQNLGSYSASSFKDGVYAIVEEGESGFVASFMEKEDAEKPLANALVLLEPLYGRLEEAPMRSLSVAAEANAYLPGDGAATAFPFELATEDSSGQKMKESFTLMSGQEIEISLEEGTKYAIQSKAGGYKAAITGKSGTMRGDRKAVAKLAPSRPKDTGGENPETADESQICLWALAMCHSFLAMRLIAKKGRKGRGK
jgi:hypothetical protein